MVGNEPKQPEAVLRGALAAKLEYLFDQIRPTGTELGPSDEAGRRYSNREIADKINQSAAGTGGVTISAAYIGELRRGIASDPRTSHVRALARAFGVDPGYFVDDHAAARVREQIELLNELRRMDVKQVALRRVLRDSGLSDASATLVEQMVARLREVERLATSGGTDAGTVGTSGATGNRGTDAHGTGGGPVSSGGTASGGADGGPVVERG